jgi:hypothetical protein
MRVKKTDKGEFVVEDEPLCLEGEAADKFLADMAKRERTKDSDERRRFLAECDRAYEASLKKPAK